MNKIKEAVERTSEVKTTALFSKNGNERYLLRMEWDKAKKSAVIIMTYPAKADELIMDQTTMLVRNGCIRNDYGSVSIVNILPTINDQNGEINKTNISIVTNECENADDIIIAFGRGTALQKEKEYFMELLKPYAEKLCTIIDSTGQPFSHPLSPRAHNFSIKKLV